MEVTKTITITGAVNANEILIYFSDHFNIILTEEQLKDLAENHMPADCSFWTDIQKYGKVSVDSSTRENITRALCQKLMGKDWPTGANTEELSKEEQRQFWTTLHSKLIKGGYRLAPEWLKGYLETVQ